MPIGPAAGPRARPGDRRNVRRLRATRRAGAVQNGPTEVYENSHHLHRRRLLRQPRPRRLGGHSDVRPHKRELSGGEADTTNNRMELTAVIQALSLLKEPCIVELWSDSKYVIDALEKGWARSWQARGLGEGR